MDIGTLTGAIEIEDQATSVLDSVMHRVEKLGDVFEEKFGAIGVAVGIGTAAIVAFTGAITALAVKGSDVNDVSSTFEHFAEKAGGAELVLQKLREGVKGTVDDLILMKDANRALAANVKLTAEDFGTLSQAAFVLQNRGLGTTEEMLNMVTSAMVTGRTRTLAMTIGVVDAEDATRKYADSLGLAVGQLTATQQAEGRRITVMKMLSDAVQEAGVQQLDFGEKVERAMASVANWFDELAGGVAKSESVGRAFDTIMESLQGFGSGKEIMEDIIRWVDKFADAVTAYGPTIINTFVQIKNWISSIWTAVTDAWNTVPDWLKEIGKAALVGAAGIYAVDKVIKILGNSQIVADNAGKDLLGTMSNYGTITDASISVGKLAIELKGARGAIQSVAEHWRLMTPALGGLTKSMPTLLGQFSLWTAVATTSWELLKVGTILWGTHKDEVERAAAAQRQSGFDTENLIKLNTILGTTFTSVDAASQEWIKRQREIKPAVDANSAAIARNTALLQAHEASVQAVVDSARKVAQDIDVQRDAYKRLGDVVLFNTESQDMFRAAMDKMIESGRALTQDEIRKYDIITQSRQATVDYGMAQLEHNKVTLEAIEIAKAHGSTEAEVAQALRTSTASLKAYEIEMKTLRDLREEVADLELKVSGHTADAEIADRERTYQAALRSFRGTSAAYDEFARNLRKKKEDLALLDHISSAQSISDRVAEADAALREYNRMIASGNYFREDLEAQREKYWELRDAATAMGSAAVAAQEAGTAATRAHNAELSQQQQIQEAIMEQEKIKRGWHTLDAAGKATGVGALVQDIVGHATPTQVDERNVDQIKDQIDTLQDQIAMFQMPTEGYKGPAITAAGNGLTEYAAWSNSLIALMQKQQDRIAQVEYLQTQVDRYPKSDNKAVVSSVHETLAALPATKERSQQSAGIHFGPGSIVMQYPIMNDANSLNKLGAVFGDAVVSRMKSKGIKIG